VTFESNKLDIEFKKLNSNDIDQIEKDWLILQSNSNCHFFLTWDWFGAWLRQVTGSFYLLSASIEGHLVALAVIVENKRKIMGLYPIKQWWLNRTGNEEYDQCWIEYNDFLLDKKYESEVRASLVTFLAQQNGWDEFILGMTSPNVEQQFEQLSSQKYYLIQDSGYQINLTEIVNSYLTDVLSRNTRQKINQTQRLLEKQGDVKFNVLILLNEKIDSLSYIIKFHSKRWAGTPTPSGFTNPIFYQTINEQVQSDKMEIAKLSLNEEPIGYLINYLYKERVYFYLSALDGKFSGKIKLGMYLHVLAVEYYRKRGSIVYDFLAGKSLYKQSLSHQSYLQNMCCYVKDNPILIVENLGRKLKKKIKEEN